MPGQTIQDKPDKRRHRAGNLTLPCLQRLHGRFDLAALHQSKTERYPYLLQTAVDTSQKTATARYDLLFAFPQSTLTLAADGSLQGEITQPGNTDFLQQLDLWWRQTVADSPVDNIPFQGGWFLFLAYELAAQIESRLQLPAVEDGSPVAVATRIPAAVIYDHWIDETIIVCESAYSGLTHKIKQDIQALQHTETAGTAAKISIPHMHEDAPEEYLQAVSKVKDYIVEGDVFQVNLSRRWQAAAEKPGATDLYRQLCKTNPAPFAGLAEYEQFAVISSSPERLVKVRNGVVETRPIAGTRPRGSIEETDTAYKSELIGHPKERAEHIMLIDLERNDLGRVCEPGTIEVNELMVLESYAHVHHLVSNVRGRLRQDITPGEVIRAVFPGGTITGCPKERCMAIIAELEQGARGAYTGSMGYLNHNGDMDLNILIRTITLSEKGISLHAGAGLVADSVAEKELDETRHKARGMLLALGSLV